MFRVTVSIETSEGIIKDLLLSKVEKLYYFVIPKESPLEIRAFISLWKRMTDVFSLEISCTLAMSFQIKHV